MTKQAQQFPHSDSAPTRLDDVLPLEAFVEQHGHIVTMRRMRWLIFNRKTNGLEDAGAVTKKAGRWYVIVPRFTEFLLAGTEA